MHKIIEWVKQHPLESGALVLVIGVAAYLLLKGGGSSSASTSTNAAAADYYGASIQAAQIAAGQQQAQNQFTLQQTAQNNGLQLQSNEVSAQLAAIQDQDAAAVSVAGLNANSNNLVTQTQADVATANIKAQQEMADTAGNDQLLGLQYQTDSQVKQAKIAADVQNTVTQAQVQENHDNLATVLGLVSSQNQVQIAQYDDQVQMQYANDQTAVDLSGQQYDYLNNESNNQAAVIMQQLTDQTQLQTNIANQVLAGGKQGGIFYGQSGTTDTAINAAISELFGEQGSAVAANQGTAASYINQNNTNSQNISNVTNGVARVLTGLFA